MYGCGGFGYGGLGYGGFGFGALWIVLLFLGLGFGRRRRFGYGGYGNSRCCNQVTYVNCGSRRRCYRKKRRCGYRY